VDIQGDRRVDLMRRLRGERAGLTIDELAESLKITRPAVRQHLTALERDGLVVAGALRPTHGRPVRTYHLTDRGQESFPKQYAWFSERLLEAVRHEKGAEGLAQWLRAIATPVAAALEPRVAGKPLPAKVDVTVSVMNELGYEADVWPDPAHPEALGIVATNCVYHGLASRIPEVCQFDLELLEQLTGAPVRHEECLVKGGRACRFRLTPR